MFSRAEGRGGKQCLRVFDGIDSTTNECAANLGGEGVGQEVREQACYRIKRGRVATNPGTIVKSSDQHGTSISMECFCKAG